jgi:MSHA biogenesis protein MshM
MFYLEHFGLSEPPFALTPDTSFLFPGPSYQEALNVLLVSLRGGEGFVKVVGEVGTGKTLLCRELLDRLGDDWYTLYLPNPLLTPLDLYRAVAEELLLTPPAGAVQRSLLADITEALLSLQQQGTEVVLCIDEAQTLPDDALEALRLLSNLETGKRKLLQIVLFAQPELDARLAQARLRQLRQRIAFGCYLQPLTREEHDSYLAHRLHKAGRQGEIFTAGALDILYRGSRGNPRLTNILAHKALLASFGKGLPAVGRLQALAAVRDTEEVQGLGLVRPTSPWVLGALLLGGLAAGYLLAGGLG